MIWSGFVAIVTMWVTSVITAEGVCLFESKCTIEGRRDRERGTLVREGERETLMREGEIEKERETLVREEQLQIKHHYFDVV